MINLVQMEWQLFFEGYLKTQPLWIGKLNNLVMLELPDHPTPKFNKSIEKQFKLGHLVEHFVAQELDLHNNIEVLAENIQFHHESRTIGEIDFVIRTKDQIAQIESSYKFYLWDESVGNTELDHWIGPNRKDSLQLKLNKIETHQFKLSRFPEVSEYFSNLTTKPIQQFVYFKAQLFIPLNSTPKFSQLNRRAVEGYYLTRKELLSFSEAKIYIPTKYEWLLQPKQSVNWLSYSNALVEIDSRLKYEKSPLIWIKTANGEIIKAFVVWW